MRIAISIILCIVLGAVLTGCATAKRATVSRRGEVVAQGTGTTLSFRSPDAGLVSAYDETADSVIHSGAVVKGSVVALNPQAGTITVTDADRAGTQVVHTGLDKTHRYELWYIPITGGTYTSTRPAQH